VIQKVVFEDTTIFFYDGDALSEALHCRVGRRGAGRFGAWARRVGWPASGYAGDEASVGCVVPANKEKRISVYKLCLGRDRQRKRNYLKGRKAYEKSSLVW
jgi:hypothetical protein